MNKPEITKMVASNDNQTKMVKIKAVRPVRTMDGTVIVEGQEALVTEDEAKEFCDKPIVGNYAFGGERFEEVTRHKIYRAVRL